MEILKHGQQLYGFVCNACGCIWKAGEIETENGAMNCPECKYKAKGFLIYPKYMVIPLNIDDQILLKRIEENNFAEMNDE